MTITRKAEIDKVVDAFKLLKARRRKEIVAGQEKQEEIALKEKEKERAASE